MSAENGVTRRDVLRHAGAATLAIAVVRPPIGEAESAPAAMQEAIRKIVGDAKINPGKVKLDVPPLVDNGNVVGCAVTVDSPMTAADHVKAIHSFNEKNPQANVISVRLGPRAGTPAIATRIRLADTQEIMAIAELSDGSFWSDRANVIITLGACLED